VELLKWCRLQWDRVLGVAAAVAGVALLVVGWSGVSGTPFVAAQMPYVVSGGLGGLFLLGTGATLWLSADLRDQWRALDQLHPRAAVGADSNDDLRWTEVEERLSRVERQVADAPVTVDVIGHQPGSSGRASSRRTSARAGANGHTAKVAR
jgi:hypothetical protein